MIYFMLKAYCEIAMLFNNMFYAVSIVVFYFN